MQSVSLAATAAIATTFAGIALADDDLRAAPLRNIALSAPDVHSRVVWSREETVTVMGVSQLGAELDAAEIADIAAFLRTLTGEIPQVTHPVLPVRSDMTPLPEDM